MFRLTTKKFYIGFWSLITVAFTFYAEFLIYKLNISSWNRITCSNYNECTKILLVADPQIIGNRNEAIRPVTPITIFDSDRYIKVTYNEAFHFVRPDVVIFLGDLMDEAHIANDEEFNNYVRRLFDIFLTPFGIYQTVKHIWLPGDNDIGGEDTQVTPKKLQRFERAFSQPSLTTFKNITFFKINRLTSIIPVYKKEREFYDTTKIFVGLSHIPLMFRPSQFTEKVINKMLPHLLFTAHEHKSMIISTDALLRQDYHITPIIPDNGEVFEYTLGLTHMYEVIIPTCSYRMGTNRIGYGFAVIENNNLKFTILWSPQRFQQLFVYLVLAVLPLSIICLLKFCVCTTYLKRKVIKYRYFV